MSVSRFLSAISVCGAALAGCSGSPCGPGGAPATGLLASSADVTLTYGNLVAGANNDCPAPGAPAGVVSLTISGAQTDGGGLLTLCVPRPDELAKSAQALGTDVKIVDFGGDKAGCTYALAASPPPVAMVSTTGMCDNGTNKAGFALSLSGDLSLTKTCNGTPAPSVAVQLSGTVAVKPQ